MVGRFVLQFRPGLRGFGPLPKTMPGPFQRDHQFFSTSKTLKSSSFGSMFEGETAHSDTLSGHVLRPMFFI